VARIRFGLWILACGLASPSALARVTNFLEPHSGISVGGGLLFGGIGHADSDPVPELAPVGTTVSGSDSVHPYVLRFGFYTERRRVSIEPFVSVLIGKPGNWTSTGVAGTGVSTDAGWGVGFNFGVHYATWSRVRISQRFEGQMQKRSLTVSFAPTAGSSDGLVLSATALLAGTALQTEIWLGDLWILNLSGGYRQGLPGPWSNSQAGTLFGGAQAAGAAVNPGDGTSVQSDFGGFYAEAGLKLAFF